MIYLKSFFGAKEKNRNEKDAFLLSDLVEDIKRLSELSGLTELKRRIIDKFSDEISFYTKDKYLKVHSSGINPCE